MNERENEEIAQVERATKRREYFRSTCPQKFSFDYQHASQSLKKRIFTVFRRRQKNEPMRYRKHVYVHFKKNFFQVNLDVLTLRANNRCI